MEISELNARYSDWDNALKDHFAEQRSNIRLISGFHYKTDGMKRFNRIVSNSDLDNGTKVRVTKNHTQVVAKKIKNSLNSLFPGVGVFPKNENEPSDQKNADLNKSVWADMSGGTEYRSFVRTMIGSFVDVGECVAKVFFDPNAGKIIGWEREVDPETGLPDPEKPLKPRFEGKVIFQPEFAFNFLTDPDAKTWQESDCIIRRHIKIDELKKRYAHDPEKLEFIEASKDESYKIFDSLTGNYSDCKDSVMLREFYFRPSAKYPLGHYIYATEHGILEEGDLPLGFPIFFCGYDEITTSPRAYGFVKQIKPNQVEINRCASMIVYHSIALGDDKILLQGGELKPGKYLPGVRLFNYNGPDVKVIPGRNGAQYLDWMDRNISEIYQLSMVQEHDAEKLEGFDANAFLYKSLKQKKQFTIYSDKIQDLFIDICEHALENARQFYSDERVVQAVGKPERVNIPEFKRSQPLSYSIKLVPVSDDFESIMGKSLQYSQVLQYAGSQMTPEQIALIIRNMPFLNKEKIGDEFVVDYDSALNDELALDRGEQVQIYKYDNHDYLIRKLITRTKRRDFQFLDPQIQQAYFDKITAHERFIAENAAEAQRANEGFIPMDGPLVKVQMYGPDPNDPEKMKLMQFPARTLEWVQEQLLKQGQQMNAIQSLPPAAQADIGRQMPNQQQQMPNLYAS